MKIAIIGAGFAAMGAAHFLRELGSLTFFDKGGPSASRLAAGLLHKFVGLNGSKNLYGDEALALSASFIQSKTKTGLERFAENDKQWLSFQKTAEAYPDEVKIKSSRSIWIEEAYVVNCPEYLNSISYVNREIMDLNELSEFDLIILAGGAASSKLATLPINPIYGQLLEVKGTAYPQGPLTGGCYAIPLQDRMVVGATYERTPQNAADILLPKLNKLLPEFKLERIVEVKGATRASTPDHMPFIMQVNAKTWAFAGLGSKGLLYHAYFGKLLASKIKTG